MAEILLTGKEYKYIVLAEEINAQVTWATYDDGSGILESLVRYFPISDTELRIDWNDDIIDADPADIQTVWDIHDFEALTEGELQEDDSISRKQKIITLLQPLVGQKFDQLAAADRWTLVAIMLYKMGIIDQGAKVKNLKDWDILYD